MTEGRGHPPVGPPEPPHRRRLRQRAEAGLIDAPPGGPYPPSSDVGRWHPKIWGPCREWAEGRGIMAEIGHRSDEFLRNLVSVRFSWRRGGLSGRSGWMLSRREAAITFHGDETSAERIRFRLEVEVAPLVPADAVHPHRPA